MNEALKSTSLYNGWIGDRNSQETSSLTIINEFNKTYASMLHKFSGLNVEDNLQVKSHLQEWIEDLTQQNKMLVSVVEELEKEAADRVSILEEKLNNTSMTSDKVMQKYKCISINHLREVVQKARLLENDVHNLVEFIRRVRDDGCWSINGLEFYSINPSNLLQKSENKCTNQGTVQDVILKKSFDHTTEFNSRESERVEKQADLSKELLLQLELKDEELNSVKKSMLEIQDLLVIKVAKKQDEVLTLRRELQNSENQYRHVLEQLQKKNCVIEELQLREKRNNVDADGDSRLYQNLQNWEKLHSEATKQLEIKQTEIKELRKEMQHLNEKIEEKFECNKNCKNVHDALIKLQDEYSASQIHWESVIAANEERIRMLNNLDDERNKEREKHNQEVANLKKTILELEKAEIIEENIKQNNGLEQAKLMISQQRLTISNLQDALTLCKNQMEELQQRSLNNLQNYKQVEKRCFKYIQKIQDLNLVIDHLQDSNLSLEVKIFECIQDVAILETQLLKYQSFKFLGAGLIKQTLKKDIEEIKCEFLTMKHAMTQGLHPEEHCTLHQEALSNELYQQNIPDDFTNFNENVIKVDDILLMKDLLQQINDQYAQLETEFFTQNKFLCCMKEQLVENKRQYESETHALQCTISELQSKLTWSENMGQNQLCDHNMLKSQLHEEFTVNLEAAQNEIVILNEYIIKLQQQCCFIRKELETKNEQIKEQVADRENTKLTLLKNELDLLKQQNEALCQEIHELKEHGDENEMNRQHIKKCFYEMQTAKSHLQKKNQEHMKEIQYLRSSYAQLHDNYQKVVKSVTILQNEIVEHKNNSTNICGESRNVIDNVRGWLVHQSLINQQLTQKFNHDQLVIHNLKHKVAVLEGLKCMCKSKVHKSHSVTSIENNSSWASLESDYIAPHNSSHQDSSEGNDALNSWLKKVGSIAHKLQKSNKFWKSKLSDDLLEMQDH